MRRPFTLYWSAAPIFWDDLLSDTGIFAKPVAGDRYPGIQGRTFHDRLEHAVAEHRLAGFRVRLYNKLALLTRPFSYTR